MALFKILKGENAKLNQQAQHEGWAYFTEDLGNFYIDTADRRVQINPRAYEIAVDVPAIDWGGAGTDELYHYSCVVSLDTDLKDYIIELARREDYGIELKIPSSSSYENTCNIINYQISLTEINTLGDNLIIYLASRRKPDSAFNLSLILTPINSI